MDGKAVGAFEDRVGEIRGGPSPEEAAQEVTLERSNELRFANPCSSADEQLGPVHGHLAQHQLTDIVIPQVVLGGGRRVGEKE